MLFKTVLKPRWILSIQISKQQNIFSFLPTNFSLCAMIVIILADRINELIQLKGFRNIIYGLIKVY